METNDFVCSLVLFANSCHNTFYFDLTIECFIDDLGRDYRGFAAETRTGKECMPWTDQDPHQHNRTEDKYPGTGLGEHNFCRNPDNEPEGAWCYTTDAESRWEYCNVGDKSDTCQSELGKCNWFILDVGGKKQKLGNTCRYWSIIMIRVCYGYNTWKKVFCVQNDHPH